MTRLFGTDGIRGVGQRRPAARRSRSRSGARRRTRSSARAARSSSARTRAARATCSSPRSPPGATSMGVDVHSVGVVPTPALAFLAGERRVRGRDHGLGVAQPGRGQRPQGARPVRPEAGRRRRGGPRGARAPRRRAAGRAAGRDRPGRGRERAPPALRRAPHGPRGARSPAAGSTSCSTPRTGPPTASGREIMRATGARVTVIHDEPDGDNINRGCGATDPASLAAAVVEHGADVGFALDGDADRCVAVDGAGPARRRRPGAGHPRARAAASGTRSTAAASSCRSCPTAGSSTPSRQAGGRIVRTPVGDKHILAAMLVSGAGPGRREERPRHRPRAQHLGRRHRHGARAAAGHDGRRRRPRRRSPSRIPLLPQQQRAIRVRHRDQWENDDVLLAAIADAEAPPGAPRPHPRPSLGHRARAAGDGRGRRRGRRVSELADAIAALAGERLH